MSKENNGDNAHERKMDQINASVVIFHNISDEDFVHPWGGRNYRINAGEEVPLGFPVADTLAKHLAMRILRSKAKADGKTGDKINLYPPAEINALIEQIMKETIAQPVEEEISETDKQHKKADVLKKTFADKIKTPKVVEIDKKDIIKDLKSRKVKFNPRDTKEKLMELLIQSEKDAE